jgi:hypothetical protein
MAFGAGDRRALAEWMEPSGPPALTDPVELFEAPHCADPPILFKVPLTHPK